MSARRASTRGPMPRAAEDPTRHRRAAVLLIVLGAVWRLGYWLEYAGELPFLRAPLYDSVVYLRQAEAIAQGDFGHPTLLAFGPLYGWFLAAVGGLAVPLQLALGVATVAMVWRIALAQQGPRWALAVVLVWLGYGLLPFYETKIMSESVGLALLVGGVWAWGSGRFAAGELRVALLAGALLALATLARPNLLLSLPFFALAALLRWRADGRPARDRARRTAGLVLGAAVVLAANGAWNAAHTGHFVPVIMVSRTASIASTRQWEGELSVFADDEQSPPSAWDVVDQAEARMRAAGEGGTPSVDVAGWARGAPGKLAQTVREVETTYQYGYYGERSEIRALDLLPTSFGVLLILGLAGAVRLWRREGWRALVPHLPLVLGVLATTTLFHPSSRYRLPMVVPLVLLSGHGLRLLVEGWRHGLAARVGVVAIVLACAFSAYRTTAYELRNPGAWELRVARGELRRGDLRAVRARALRAYELASDPETRRRAASLLDNIKAPE